MREIKFRCWDKIDKRMIGPLPFNRVIANFSGLDDDAWQRLEWTQYTGLKDSTGKEIYEGDIITSNYHNDIYDYGFELTSFVEFINGCFWLNVHKCELHYYNEFSIVVGNIYENPELLE